MAIDEQLFPNKARCPFTQLWHQSQTSLGKNIG